MKKFITVFTVALAAFALAVSCQKIVEEPQGVTPISHEGEQITITVAIPNGLTRMSLTQDAEDPDGDIKLAWENSDVIYVIDAADPDNKQAFQIASIDTGKPYIATFTGTAVTADSFNILYGAESISAAEAVDYSVQSQSADASTAGIKNKYMAVLEGVDSCQDIEFSNTWATSHGDGSFKQSGALRMRLQLPDAITAVKSVALIAEDDVFYTNNACSEKTDNIKVVFDNDVTPGDKNVITVYAMLPWAEIAIGASSDLQVAVEDQDSRVWVKSFSPGSDISLKTGVANAIKLNRNGFEVLSPFAGGTGIEGDPWLIATAEQMQAVKDNLVAGETKHFKLIDDIDMTGIEWEMLNPNSPYNMAVDFDGDNHTVSYLNRSLFYVLKGSVKNLILDHSSIAQRGILAEYIQQSGNEVTNVTVSNGTVDYNGNNVGGLIGTINNGSDTAATITDCIVSDTDVNGVGVVGGVIGFADALVNISGCSYTGGTVSGSARYIGGFVGSTGNYASVISDCHVEDAVINAAVSNNDYRAGGFVGQLQTNVTIKGCSVGSSDSKVDLILSAPASGKVYNAGGFVGVGYGKITKNGDVRNAAFVNLSSGNTVGNAQINLGGFAGYNTGNIEDSDVDVSASSVTGSHIGGFVGYALQNSKIENCTVKGSISGTQKTGGFVGLAESGTISNCSASSVVSKYGSTTGTDAGIDFGGFVGIVSKTVTLTKCSALADISINTNYVGGFAGSLNPGAGFTATVSKCWSTGNVTSSSAQCGGFIGHIAANADGTVIVEDCYETGDLIETNQRNGGFIGQINSGKVTVSRCYASGTVSGSFAIGGLIGFMNNTATVQNCAAWNSSVTAGSIGTTNWSTGAVIGVAWPVATISNNYRLSSMSLTAWWVPDALYMHPDVSASSPLIVKDKSSGELRATSATAAANGQDNYPLFAYHGKVSQGMSLSELASTTLGWDSEVWDFTGILPTLK